MPKQLSKQQIEEIVQKEGLFSIDIDIDSSINSIDEKERTVDFIFSDNSVDGHNTIVDQNSWLLDRFMKNPVVLFAHNSRALPVGRVVKLSVENNKLIGKIQFVQEDMGIEPLAVWNQVKGKFLRTVSVGFMPHFIDYDEEKKVVVYKNNELYEVSVTPLPSNSNAIARSMLLPIKSMLLPIKKKDNFMEEEMNRLVEQLAQEKLKSKELQDRLVRVEQDKVDINVLVSSREKDVAALIKEKEELSAKIAKIEQEKTLQECEKSISDFTGTKILPQEAETLRSMIQGKGLEGVVFVRSYLETVSKRANIHLTDKNSQVDTSIQSNENSLEAISSKEENDEAFWDNYYATKSSKGVK